MDNREMRELKEKLGLIDYKINYKTGVHLPVIEDFFSGRTEELAPKDRERLEALLLAEAKKNSKALNYGGMRNVLLQNKQCIFERRVEGERVMVAINMDSNPYWAHFDAGCGQATDLITGQLHDFGGGSELPPYSAAFWLMER